MSEQLPSRKFEAPNQADFTQEYEKVAVPAFHSFSDSNDLRLQNRINRFFTDIMQSLQLNALMQEELILYKEDTNPDGIQRTLALGDFQILATVSSTQREGMYYTTAEKAPLTAATIVALKGYHEGDSFLTDILFRR